MILAETLNIFLFLKLAEFSFQKCSLNVSIFLSILYLIVNFYCQKSFILSKLTEFLIILKYYFLYLK